jgi:predicted regulator of Ras-like GTPase activity (Roadblock/LC7/MglB family)
MNSGATAKNVSRGHIILSEEQYHRISEELDQLRAKLNANLVLFGDMNGQLICQKGNIPGTDLPILAALIAGDFSATSEISRMLGANNTFRMHFHEGNERNLYVASVGEQFFLAVIFNHAVTLGMVRIFTQKTIERIQNIVTANFEEMVKISNIIDLELRQHIQDGLNKILE